MAGLTKGSMINQRFAGSPSLKKIYPFVIFLWWNSRDLSKRMQGQPPVIIYQSASLLNALKNTGLSLILCIRKHWRRNWCLMRSSLSLWRKTRKMSNYKIGSARYRVWCFWVYYIVAQTGSRGLRSFTSLSKWSYLTPSPEKITSCAFTCQCSTRSATVSCSASTIDIVIRHLE